VSQIFTSLFFYKFLKKYYLENNKYDTALKSQVNSDYSSTEGMILGLKSEVRVGYDLSNCPRSISQGNKQELIRR